MSKRRPLNHARARDSRWGGWCAVCNSPIEPGQCYYDASGKRRAHIDCGNRAEREPWVEKSWQEQRAAQDSYYQERARRVMGKSRA